jgi:hypothetical protein
MSNNAKLAYLLSSCPKISRTFYNRVFDQYKLNINTPTKNSVAYRKNFLLFLTLGETIPDNYNISGIKYSFLEDEYLSYKVLNHSNRNLNISEINYIQNELSIRNINNAKDTLSMCSIASMIKTYSQSYSYLIIPIILNYGRGDNFVHQTLLIIDFTGKIMFYEPYGKYNKYNMDYSRCICNLFKIFGTFLSTSTNYTQYKICDTYHNVYNLDRGIQDIIMQKNNNRFDKFKIQYDEIIKKIQIYFPDENYNKNAISITDDKTVNIVRLMSVLNKYDNRNKKKEFNHIYEEAMKLYCGMNSKTCVTITLVEIDYFLGIPKKDQEKKLNEFYNKFNVEVPNNVLMNKLSDLLNVFDENEKKTLLQILKTNNKTTYMCKLLSKK